MIIGVEVQTRTPVALDQEVVINPPSAIEEQQGIPLAGVDKHYVHDQTLALDEWHVVHNLGKFPSVTVMDSAGTEVEGQVTHNSINDCTLNFTAPFSGEATCN